MHSARFLGNLQNTVISESEVTTLAARYMEVAGRRNPDPRAHEGLVSWPFECVTFDQLLIRIAHFLQHAVTTLAVGPFYFCANSEGTGSCGFHWVSAILVVQIDGVPNPVDPAGPGSA